MQSRSRVQPKRIVLGKARAGGATRRDRERRRAMIQGGLTIVGVCALFVLAYFMMPLCDPLTRTTYCRN